MRGLVISSLVLSLLVLSPAYSSRLIDWTAIDDSLNMLEYSLNQAESELRSSERLLEEQAMLSASLQAQLEDCELRLEKSDAAMRRWRIFSGVMAGTAILAIIVAAIK